MRMIIVATAAVLAAAPAAYAQSNTPSQAPQTEQSQTQAPTIKRVDVVDIVELPPEVQSRVNTATSEMTEAQLESLREMIDAHEMASAALEAAGVTSEIVIAAAMSQDGTLTLITRKS